MRISDDRYCRDHLRLDLALRFIRHGARTHTIRRWTGLTDDRIRKLHKNYASETSTHVPRQRGKSPAQAGFFIRTSRVQQESALLASLFWLLGVMPAHAVVDHEHPLPDIARGERLCQAFEAYILFTPTNQITFEHAVLLVNELARNAELRLGDCAVCGALVVVDTLGLRDLRCAGCSEASQMHC